MKQRQSRGLMPWILTLLCAVLLTVWVLGSMPAAPKEGAAVAAGTAYLDSAAAKDASAIAETLREREKQRRAELLAKQKQEERRQRRKKRAKRSGSGQNSVSVCEQRILGTATGAVTASP